MDGGMLETCGTVAVEGLHPEYLLSVAVKKAPRLGKVAQWSLEGTPLQHHRDQLP